MSESPDGAPRPCSSARDSAVLGLLQTGFSVAPLQLFVGLFQVLVGAMVLVAPHQFATPPYAALQSHLDLWGVAFLVAGANLLGVAMLRRYGILEIQAHLLAGAGMIVLAYGLALVGGWTGVTNFMALGLATALAPLSASRVRAHPWGPRGDLFSLAVGLGCGLTGLTILGLPGQFGSTLYDVIRPGLPWLGVAFTASGLLLASTQILPTTSPRLSRLAYLLAGASLLTFFLASSVPLRAWVGMAYYGGFGVVIALLPWLRRPLRGVDPVSLRTRLAVVLCLAATVPVLVVTLFVLDRQEEAVLRETLTQQERRAVAMARMVAMPMAAAELSSLLLSSADGSTVYLVDERGGAIVHPDQALASSRADLSATPVVAAVLADRGESGSLQLRRGSAGLLAGYARVPGSGWGVVVERPVANVLQENREQRDMAFAALLVSAVVAALMGMLLAGGLTHSLSTVVAAVRQVATGGPAVELPSTDFTELRQLGQAVEEMRRRLAKSEAERSRLLSAEREARVAAEGALREREALVERLREVNQQLVLSSDRERELRERFEAQVAQMNALLGSLSDAVSIVDAEGRLLFQNEAAAKLPLASDGRRGEGQDRRGWTLARADGSDLHPSEQPLRRVLRGEQLAEVGYSLAWPEGPRRQVVLSSGTVRDVEGRTALAILVYRDVTALRRLEQLRTDFVNAVSHDLRNPLTAVMGQAQLLQRTLARQGMEKEVQGAEAILTNAHRMNTMIQDLVDSGRLEAGRMELYLEPTDLLQLVRDIADRAIPLEARARIRVEAPEWLPHAMLDAARMERALVNLLTNALKYSRPESPVVVRMDPGDRELRISVSDEGVGIPAEELPRIFERFYRASTARRSEGLGLGLYITRLIVEAHGGRIRAESQVGQGSTFHITLPLGRRE